MKESLEKALVNYLEQNSCYVIKDGALECSDGSWLEMFICGGPDAESISIITYKQYENDDWMDIDTDAIHERYLGSAILELEEFIQANNEILPTNTLKLAYHHIDIIPGAENNALIRMHWNIQEQSEEEPTRGDKWEEKIYLEIAKGINLDKHKKLVKELRLKGDEAAADRLQSVLDSYFAHKK